jgi:hypothetical protein
MCHSSLSAALYRQIGARVGDSPLKMLAYLDA